MELTKQQRAYLKAQKQAFKLYNSIFGCDDYEETKDGFISPFISHYTLTKEQLEHLTNPSKNEKRK